MGRKIVPGHEALWTFVRGCAIGMEGVLTVDEREMVMTNMAFTLRGLQDGEGFPVAEQKNLYHLERAIKFFVKAGFWPSMRMVDDSYCDFRNFVHFRPICDIKNPMPSKNYSSVISWVLPPTTPLHIVLSIEIFAACLELLHSPKRMLVQTFGDCELGVQVEKFL